MNLGGSNSIKAPYHVGEKIFLGGKRYRVKKCDVDRANRLYELHLIPDVLDGFNPPVTTLRSDYQGTVKSINSKDAHRGLARLRPVTSVSGPTQDLLMTPDIASQEVTIWDQSNSRSAKIVRSGKDPNGSFVRIRYDDYTERTLYGPSISQDLRFTSSVQRSFIWRNIERDAILQNDDRAASSLATLHELEIEKRYGAHKTAKGLKAEIAALEERQHLIRYIGQKVHVDPKTGNFVGGLFSDRTTDLGYLLDEVSVGVFDKDPSSFIKAIERRINARDAASELIRTSPTIPNELGPGGTSMSLEELTTRLIKVADVDEDRERVWQYGAKGVLEVEYRGSKKPFSAQVLRQHLLDQPYQETVFEAEGKVVRTRTVYRNLRQQLQYLRDLQQESRPDVVNDAFDTEGYKEQSEERRFGRNYNPLLSGMEEDPRGRELIDDIVSDAERKRTWRVKLSHGPVQHYTSRPSGRGLRSAVGRLDQQVITGQASYRATQAINPTPQHQLNRIVLNPVVAPRDIGMVLEGELVFSRPQQEALEDVSSYVRFETARGGRRGSLWQAFEEAVHRARNTPQPTTATPATSNQTSISEVWGKVLGFGQSKDSTAVFEQAEREVLASDILGTGFFSESPAGEKSTVDPDRVQWSSSQRGRAAIRAAEVESLRKHWIKETRGLTEDQLHLVRQRMLKSANWIEGAKGNLLEPFASRLTVAIRKAKLPDSIYSHNVVSAVQEMLRLPDSETLHPAATTYQGIFSVHLNLQHGPSTAEGSSQSMLWEAVQEALNRHATSQDVLSNAVSTSFGPAIPVQVNGRQHYLTSKLQLLNLYKGEFYSAGFVGPEHLIPEPLEISDINAFQGTVETLDNPYFAGGLVRDLAPDRLRRDALKRTLGERHGGFDRRSIAQIEFNDPHTQRGRTILYDTLEHLTGPGRAPLDPARQFEAMKRLGIGNTAYLDIERTAEGTIWNVGISIYGPQDNLLREVNLAPQSLSHHYSGGRLNYAGKTVDGPVQFVGNVSDEALRILAPNPASAGKSQIINTIVGHNIGFDVRHLVGSASDANLNQRFLGKDFVDTQLMEYMANPGGLHSASLESLGWKYGHLGVAEQEAHSALADTRLNKAVAGTLRPLATSAPTPSVTQYRQGQFLKAKNGRVYEVQGILDPSSLEGLFRQEGIVNLEGFAEDLSGVRLAPISFEEGRNKVASIGTRNIVGSPWRVSDELLSLEPIAAGDIPTYMREHLEDRAGRRFRRWQWNLRDFTADQHRIELIRRYDDQPNLTITQIIQQMEEQSVLSSEEAKTLQNYATQELLTPNFRHNDWESDATAQQLRMLRDVHSREMALHEPVVRALHDLPSDQANEAWKRYMGMVDEVAPLPTLVNPVTQAEQELSFRIELTGRKHAIRPQRAGQDMMSLVRTLYNKIASPDFEDQGLVGSLLQSLPQEAQMLAAQQMQPAPLDPTSAAAQRIRERNSSVLRALPGIQGAQEAIESYLYTTHIAPALAVGSSPIAGQGSIEIQAATLDEAIQRISSIDPATLQQSAPSHDWLHPRNLQGDVTFHVGRDKTPVTMPRQSALERAQQLIITNPLGLPSEEGPPNVISITQQHVDRHRLRPGWVGRDVQDILAEISGMDPKDPDQQNFLRALSKVGAADPAVHTAIGAALGPQGPGAPPNPLHQKWQTYHSRYTVSPAMAPNPTRPPSPALTLPPGPPRLPPTPHTLPGGMSGPHRVETAIGGVVAAGLLLGGVLALSTDHDRGGKLPDDPYQHSTDQQIERRHQEIRQEISRRYNITVEGEVDHRMSTDGLLDSVHQVMRQHFNTTAPKVSTRDDRRNHDRISIRREGDQVVARPI